MHTSTVLTPADFSYAIAREGSPNRAAFSDFAPDYHPQDRAAVLWDDLHAGLFENAYALLALTTAFYEALRDKHGAGAFYDYPQHLSIKADDSFSGDFASEAFASRSWGMLDVWPRAKWHAAPRDPASLIQRLFDLQVNRVFWPASWWENSATAQDAGRRIPAYVKKMLATSVKQVFLYATPQPDVWIDVQPPVEQVIEDVVRHLPQLDAKRKEQIINARRDRLAAGTSAAGYQRVPVETFLHRYEDCFAADHRASSVSMTG